MYCTLEITFQAEGDEAVAIAKFESMRRDLAAMLRNHPDVEVANLDQPLTPDDVNVGLDREEDFEELE